MNGCKDGNCQLLFSKNAKCEHRKEGKLFVCDMMNQEDGRCRCVAANNRNRRKNNGTNNSFFRKKSDQTFALLVAQKEVGYKPDVLPYKRGK
jgi:hypothetical protein